MAVVVMVCSFPRSGQWPTLRAVPHFGANFACPPLASEVRKLPWARRKQLRSTCEASIVPYGMILTACTCVAVHAESTTLLHDRSVSSDCACKTHRPEPCSRQFVSIAHSGQALCNEELRCTQHNWYLHIAVAPPAHHGAMSRTPSHDTVLPPLGPRTRARAALFDAGTLARPPG